jgi:acetylornithine deacetylase/succinyl-diaminopimelate desuccinylase-like protein
VDALVQWFGELGAEVEIEQILPGRPNIYAIWRGRSERWLGIDVHLDTVGVEEMLGDPFSGEEREGRIYGRGAVDTKASLAVILTIMESFKGRASELDPNLLVVGTMDEEIDALGAFAFVEWIRKKGLSLDQLLVAEPTMCTPVFGHKGVVRLKFEVQGRSTHTSQPHLGENAVTAASQLVLALAEEDKRLKSSLSQSTLGWGTLTVSLIQGGSGINVVPDRCAVSIDRRLVEKEDPEEVIEGIGRIASEACPLGFSVERLVAHPAFLVSPETPFLQQLAQWSLQPPSIVPYGTNAWAYDGLAEETAVMGPGSIDQAHGAEEWVEVSELEKMAQIYARWWGLA